MRSFNFDRNVRFAFLLPYGFASIPALTLSVPAADAAYIIYQADKSMESRINDCYLNYQARLRSLRVMAELGYIEQYNHRRGMEKWETTTQYRLTQAGFYFLTNTPDQEVEEEREKKIPRIKNRNKNELSYFPKDPGFFANRQQLYDLAQIPDPTPEDLQAFEQLFLESVEYDNLGLLATQPVLAENVQVKSSLRYEAHYRAWKLSNIEALFKVNNYLTTIDRRHLPQPPIPKPSGEKQINIYDFCRYTLNHWYCTHPNSFLYTEPQENLANIIQPDWENTPTFYSINEIDDNVIEVESENKINQKRSTKSYRYLCMGVAIGKRKNYIVHHTRPSETPWQEFIEKNTATCVQMRLNKINRSEPVFGANRSIENAIMVCPSVTHFTTLFNAAPQKAERKRKHRIGAPYDSVCIVPVCPSGAMQLRGLLENSPLTYETAIRSYLLQHEGFEPRNAGWDERDQLLTITYQNTPVFIAHTMDWRKLSLAKELYEEGTRFYVSCFPEQVKFIKSIMPEVEFL